MKSVSLVLRGVTRLEQEKLARFIWKIAIKMVHHLCAIMPHISMPNFDALCLCVCLSVSTRDTSDNHN